MFNQNKCVYLEYCDNESSEGIEQLKSHITGLEVFHSFFYD